MSDPSRKTALSTRDLLSRSVWAQTDELLAKALLDSHRLCERLDEACPKGGDVFETLEAEALLVFQSISEAAALRGMFMFGSKGDRHEFDPVRHEIAALSAPRRNTAAKSVTIDIPGVLRRDGGAERIIIRAVSKRGTKKNADLAKKKNSRKSVERSAP